MENLILFLDFLGLHIHPVSVTLRRRKRGELLLFNGW